MSSILDIFSIIIENYDVIDVLVIYKCNFVCKELNNFINKNNNWNKYKFIKKDYDNITCCNNNIIAFGKCFNCLKQIKLITATDVKKIWYLNDKDLLNFNVYNKTNNIYKKNIRLFDNNEILEYSLIKYNGMKNFNIFKQNKLNKNKNYIESKKKEKENTINLRMNILSYKLDEKKILHGYDSDLCNQYINGERNDLDFIIETMQEMDYFFKNTCYRSILSKLIDNFKLEIKKNYDNTDLNHNNDLISEETPSLSLKAKKMALKGKIKKFIPDYCIKYL